MPHSAPARVAPRRLIAQSERKRTCACAPLLALAHTLVTSTPKPGYPTLAGLGLYGCRVMRCHCTRMVPAHRVVQPL